MITTPPIVRLPYTERPGYDCRNANATCPGCNRLRAEGKRPADHGINGGAGFFAVQTTMADDRKIVVALEVSLKRYPATVDTTGPLWDARSFVSTGTALTVHVQAKGGVPCDYLGTCEGDTISYVQAHNLWATYGDQATQTLTEQGWVELGAVLRRQAAHYDGLRRYTRTSSDAELIAAITALGCEVVECEWKGITVRIPPDHPSPTVRADVEQALNDHGFIT